MFQNNFKIAWRNLKKNKIYAVVTLLGLAMGIASVLLIYRMVSFELSFNKGFKNYDRIVRVVNEEKSPDGELNHSVCMPLPAMEEMKAKISQFENAAIVRETWANITVPNPNGGAPLKKFNPRNGETAFFSRSSFLEIFDFKWLAGNRATALDTPDGIVLTKKMAEKCFGNWDQAVGKVVMVDNIIPVTVTGVMDDLPVNCDFNFPYLIAYDVVLANDEYFFLGREWGSCNSNDQIYALMHDPTQIEATNKALYPIGKEHYVDSRTGIRGRVHVLQPLSDLHFNEDYSHSGFHRISRDRLAVLSAIGVFILILACFNFINLTTAQASLRAKEVGVRKTLGGRQGQLISQFMTETGLIVIISAALGVFMAYLALPLLKYVSDVPNDLAFLNDYRVWAFLLTVSLFITVIAGIYPSLVLSRFNPVNALKNNLKTSRFNGVALRKSLVVLQFVIAQALIVGAIITILQLDYINTRELGFRKDLVFTFSVGVDQASLAKQTAFKQKILAIPEVEQMSFSSDQPLSGNTWSSNFRFGTRPEDEPYGITLKFADEDYQKTYGLNLLAGRWYNASDTLREVVVNEKLLEKLGEVTPEEALNQQIRLGSQNMLQIVGVVENFHTHSLHQAHEPLLISTQNEYYWEIGTKINTQNIKQTKSKIKTVFDEVYPEQIFDGSFLDDRIANFYESDNRLSATCKGFGFLAILISCLGLFGLAAHSTTQRVKEIGIRKVLGASVGSIITLLSKDFLRLVFIALIIASPLAYYLMEQWLQDFVYRINIPIWVFILAGVLALVVAFLTVGFQSMKAALGNPVKAIKTE
ncbi:MAG: ABC transporter permease [Saprospiraceae bacterium]|nr:ABC transporter permease [Saprospiraceae bacterium]